MGGIRTDRIGEKRTMNNGMEATIIDYRGVYQIDIEFEDGTVVENRRYDKFQLGQIDHPDYPNPYARNDRTGEKRTMRNGLVAEIIRYGNSKDIDVQFPDGSVVAHRPYAHFRKGKINKPE